MAVWTSGPALGDLEAGAVAAATSVDVSIVSGGVACIAGIAVMAATMPGFRTYDARVGMGLALGVAASEPAPESTAPEPAVPRPAASESTTAPEPAPAQHATGVSTLAHAVEVVSDAGSGS